MTLCVTKIITEASLPAVDLPYSSHKEEGVVDRNQIFTKLRPGERGHTGIGCRKSNLIETEWRIYARRQAII